MRLEIALNELHKVTCVEEVLFWGKILGTKNDYFIALLINYKGHYEFPIKTFYYASSTTLVFTPLPDISESHITDNEIFHSAFFSGDPTEILKLYETEDDQGNMDQDPVEKKEEKVDDPLNISDSDDNIQVVVEKKKNFTELNKLSFVVRSVDFDTNIFPQGVFKLIPIHELRRNDNFKGLNKKELTSIGKFHHFRHITEPERKINIEKDEAIFNMDILDSIEKDPVKCK